MKEPIPFRLAEFIGLGLVLLLALAGTALVAHGADYSFIPDERVVIEPGKQRPPNIKDWEFKGERIMARKEAPGDKECLLKEYTRGDVTLSVVYFEGKPAAFWHFNNSTNRTYGLIDGKDKEEAQYDWLKPHTNNYGRKPEGMETNAYTRQEEKAGKKFGMEFKMFDF